MKKIWGFCLTVFMSILLLVSGAEAAETKVQLHDTLLLDGFVTEYNRISEYPVADYSSHNKHGDYESYVAVLDQGNVMLINVNGKGLISNIILMHRGEVSPEEQKKLLSVFVGMNVALGYPAKEEDMLTLTEAFQRLDIASADVLASRLDRSDIERSYTFFKTENPAQQVRSIVMEAVVE